MLIDLHSRVMDHTVELVSGVGIGDLGRATPCAGWTLRDLLGHMVGQNLGFATAAAGAAADIAAYAPRPLGDDPARTYAASARSVCEAFARPGLLDDDVYLAEVRGGTTVPASVAVGFHLVDYVVHGWDVARTLGRRPDFDDEALTEALRVAEAVPDSAKSTAPGSPFAPAAPTTSPDLLDRIVATLGRDPAWAVH